MLPALPVTFLKASEFAPLEQAPESVVNLNELLKGKIGVIDLWHSKCTRCPVALEKIDGYAEELGKDVVLVALAIAQGPDQDIVADLVEESWANLNHLYIQEKDKDAFKSTFGYSAVPFVVIFDENGTIVKSGEPKTIDIPAEIMKLSNKSSGSSNTISFNEDF